MSRYGNFFTYWNRLTITSVIFYEGSRKGNILKNMFDQEILLIWRIYLEQLAI